MGAWTGLIWLSTWTGGGVLLICQWNFVFYKMLGISWSGEELLVSQGGFCCMEFVEDISNIRCILLMLIGSFYTHATMRWITWSWRSFILGPSVIGGHVLHPRSQRHCIPPKPTRSARHCHNLDDQNTDYHCMKTSRFCNHVFHA
jgi:hypothetical protein